MQRRIHFVLKPCLVGYFLCLISSLHLLVPPIGYFCHYSPHRVVSIRMPEKHMKLQLLWTAATPPPRPLCIAEVLRTKKIRFPQSSFLHLCPSGPPTLFGRISWSCRFVLTLTAFPHASCRPPSGDWSTVCATFITNIQHWLEQIN